MYSSKCNIFVGLALVGLLFLVEEVMMQSREKRAVNTDEQPKMMTNSGHLVFRTGENHNISFKTGGGSGRVLFNEVDLEEATKKIDENSEAIKQLQSTTPPPDVSDQVTQLQGDVASLQARVTNLENNGGATIPPDFDSRLSALESQMSDLQSEVNGIKNDLELNNCASHPCQNGGSCVSMYSGFYCHCTSNWKGTTCRSDVNECSLISGGPDDCQNGATCTNTQGGFSCSCAPNWYGPKCTIQYDDCTTASNTELCGHGTCVNLNRVVLGQAKYDCICFEGWQQSANAANPACTSDVDECQARIYPCSNDPYVPCINVQGSYYCSTCPTGYTGNGHQCADINECNTNNGGCSQSPYVTCTNTQGSRTCGPCPAGYFGDGVTCTNIGICSQDNGGCSPYATCTNNPGVPSGRVCTCLPGYTGNGEGSNGCTSTGSCDNSPCVNGRCQVSGSTYICICEPGYEGNNCQNNINDCSSNPCQNEGTCTDGINGYTCSCALGYSGDNCEEYAYSCNVRYRSQTGSFQFPSSGSDYPHGVSCAWVIEVDSNSVVEINFPQFSVESHPECAYDFLQINDGPTASDYSFGRYCDANRPPPTLTSTSYEMYFWFKSDVSVASDGFTVNWVSKAPVCGGDLDNEDYGVIRSPGYPGNYPTNRDCVWRITVDLRKVITIAFGTLELEHHETCDYDYLEIRDGLSDTSPLIGRYCSTVNPVPLITIGPYAWIKFHSDASLTDGGFQIIYTSSLSSAACGGHLTADSAILISPNFPNAYPHDAECIWIIEVPSTEVVTLNITDLQLETSGNCVYDYVEIRDGEDELSPFMGRYCNPQAIPPPIVSSQNFMFVKFHSDFSVAPEGGFRARYYIDCGGIFTDDGGEMRSPYFPNAYPHNRQCDYLVIAPEEMIVTVTFITFDIEAHDNCIYDSLKIYDSSSANENDLISNLCGSYLPPPVSSTGNTMLLRFETDGSISNYGFRATYDFDNEIPGGDGCGGRYTDQTGIFSSPTNGNEYPHGVDCFYVVTVEDGYIIRLTFETFSLETHHNCIYDYVEVYDNSTDAVNPLYGRFCGTTPPPQFTSSGNVITVVFHTDSSVAQEGFTASYVGLDATTACGGYYFTNTGVITSPGFPDGYPHNRECVWGITVNEGQQIRLNFTSFFLEVHTNCVYDYLEIRNGGYATSPLIGTYCGTDINPSVIISHSNRIYLKFVSDNSQTADGFRMEWDGSSTGCGGELTTPTGSFTSPNYPYSYGHNAECFWIITVNQGSTVSLVFSDFDIESHSLCQYDYVKVYDGATEADSVIITYCGEVFPLLPTQSTDYQMRVKFRSDFSISGRGFLASYASNCNNVLKRRTGVIESPNYPNPYPHNVDCVWRIQANLGSTINLTFTNLHLEDHNSCGYDYVQVRDGDDETARVIITICGQLFLPEGYSLQSTGSNLWIHFVTDSSVSELGFRAIYAVDGCGGEINDNSGVITSPGYPQGYPHEVECDWIVTSEIGSSITLTINDFDLETSNNCQYDALLVYSGTDDSLNYLTQLCDEQTKPTVVTTTGNEMYVRFYTDSSINGRGFNATFLANSNGCGGNQTAPSGHIQSKNFPQPYPHNYECTWLINVADDHRVQLTFLAFDIENVDDCQHDYLELFDGIDDTAVLIAKLCGSDLPDVYYSTSNHMFIRILSDNSVSSTGFEANFDTACGGRRDATVDGVVKSSNYPNNYNANQNCSWVIESDNPGDRITLTFTHIDIEESTDGLCAHDNVNVFNGNDEYAPLVIGPYCGTVLPQAFTSYSAAVTITFLSDGSVQKTGFRVTYTTSTSACGGDFTALSGFFNSPGYPNNYPLSTECVWSIQSSLGSGVQVSFSVFDMESSSNCGRDYLEFRESDETGTLIGRICGNTIPTNISSTQSLWVKFVSDGSGTGIGFMAAYAQKMGNDYSGTTGQLSSPLYPSAYPVSVVFRWTVTVSPGAIMQLRFLDFELETGVNDLCPYDVLEIHDGADLNSAVLLSTCGSTIPATVYTTGSVAFLYFLSDSSVVGRGFLIEWQEIGATPTPGLCHFDLQSTESNQILQSPGFPYGYDINLDCTWLIHAPIGSTVYLQFTTMNLESHSACYWDSVSVFDGDSQDQPQLANLCGRDVGSPIVSSDNTLLVVFQTDASVNYTGFQANYTTHCGGRIRADQGVLTSPNYPSNYANNLDCQWHIVVSPGRTIQVNITEFQLQTSTNCDSDYLQFFNGESTNSPALGQPKYCGSVGVTMLTTSSNLVVVKMVTDENTNNRGFRIVFTALQTGCGDNIILNDQLQSGYFTSPGYPNNYPSSTECAWTISAPAGQAIQIDFLSIDIQFNPQCDLDYLEIHDGPTENSNRLAKLCGTIIPNSVVSLNNAMYILFHSDYLNEAAGFNAMYKYATCGGTVSGVGANITSPNFPAAYENNLQCEWIFHGTTGHYLTISFSLFNLGVNNDNCATGDKVVVFDGKNSSYPVLATSCGTSLPSAIDTSDSFAFVQFITNSTQQSSGFIMGFSSSLEACGGELFTSTGTFTSPNYPGLYAHARVCEWKISVQTGHRITLNFDDFDLEDVSGCQFDSVQVYNGLENDAPILGTYCGVTAPQDVASSGNHMRVVFRTDSNVNARGFSARYDSQDASVCGGTLVASQSTEARFFSPGYQLANYSANLDCAWIITNPNIANSSIYLDFDSGWNIEDSSNCNYDFLEIRAGVGVSGELIGKYCGPDAPLPIVLPHASLYARFFTDDTVQFEGFSATYGASVCGGLVSGTDGVITSPNFPLDYNHFDKCVWLVEGPPGSQLTLSFTAFDIESHPDCIYDYLAVFNGGNFDSPKISGQNPWCGNTLPSTVTTSSNKALVQFMSDAFEAAQGFRLEWTTVTSGCGGNFHGNTGTIKSSNYPSNYHSNEECIWTIIVEHGYHVKFEFDNNFDIKGTGYSCTGDVLTAFDGGSTSDRPLGNFCGNTSPLTVNSTNNQLTFRMRSDNTNEGTGFQGTWTVECGLTFNTTNGTITSPGYPNNYDNGLSCDYLINYDPTKRLRIRFQEPFEIEEATNCAYDGLKIYNSSNSVLGTYCGDSLPDPIESEGSMFLNFYSDSSDTRVGFSLKFEQGCGGEYVGPAGQVSTTDTGTYRNNENCTWLITVNDNRVVELVFSMFDIEVHSSCLYDSLTIYDGPTTNNPVLAGPLCGEVLPDPIKSTNKTMLLNFLSDVSSTHGGFKAGYYETFSVAQGCGGSLTSPSGTFTDIDVDNDGLYEDNLVCTWLISVDVNKLVQLSFGSSFDIESGLGGQCDYDYIEVRDGISPYAPLVSKFCGLNAPSNFNASSNQLYVKFLTDSSIGGTGFTITYGSVDPTCGGVYNATSTPQTITSPNYPNNYDHNLRCRWTVAAPNGEEVRIKVNAMDIESHDNCIYDHLELRDFPLRSNGQVMKYCGSTIPGVFNSVGGSAQINFVTDFSSTGQGFSLTYYISDCSNDITKDSGRVTSPNWPVGTYNDNHDCFNNITSSQGTFLSIYFTSFDIEFHANCDYDYLSIYNVSDTSTEVAKYCGTAIPDPLFFNGNLAILRFVTDSTVTYAGFDLTFSASTISPGCGGPIIGPSGSFTSPLYPQVYPSNVTCEWLVEVPAGKGPVTLSFTQINLPGPEGVCNNGVVEIYNGQDSNAPAIGRYCGQRSPADIVGWGSTRRLFVRFVSGDPSQQTTDSPLSTGFRINFSS
ncbi:cubilin-like isoform X2 [Antedon mediterranea]|uniref:cubilin-like isoform X2 n=1 Tax=Antedon mediterranea TaxID=105859 RepID=UPI003AF9DAC9